MAKSVLGPEDLAPADQEGGHRMAQAMEADTDEVCLRSKLGEPVAQGAGGEAPLMVAVRREDPLTERGVLDSPRQSCSVARHSSTVTGRASAAGSAWSWWDRSLHRRRFAQCAELCRPGR